MAEVEIEEVDLTCPFVEYMDNEDKSQYPLASDTNNPRNNKKYIDVNDDFIVGDSGGFLFNKRFTFTNIDALRQTALYYEKHGKYEGDSYVKDSPQYNKWWIKETRRRREGLTAPCGLDDKGNIVDVRVTGDHYSYLNYGVINRTPTETEVRRDKEKGILKSKDRDGFPRFWDGDYWSYKVDEFCENNGFHVTKGKARRKGYSYKEGNSSANFLNLYPSQNVIFAAYDSKYLTKRGKIAYMAKRALDFFEDNTYWSRGYYSQSLDETMLGIRKQKGGSKIYGWKSSFTSVSLFSDSSGAAGDKAARIKFEESGINPSLLEALGVTMSTTESGAKTIGFITIFGTGGTKDANWEDFDYLFFNPQANNMMPLENVWDDNARSTMCGFFHPQIWNMEDDDNILMDVNGNSNLKLAYQYDYNDKKKAEKTKSIGDYILYKAQRANSPLEAFARGGENMFSSVELDNHILDIRLNDNMKFGIDGLPVMNKEGKVEYKPNSWIASNTTQQVHPYLEKLRYKKGDDVQGCVRMWFAPFKFENKIPDALYRIWYDPFGVDKEKDTITDKHSLASVQVYMRINNFANTKGDILVASYCGRPERMEDVDRLVLLLSKYYNAKILFENDRGETLTNFRKWKELDRLASEPNIAWDTSMQAKGGRSYGLSMGTGARKVNALGYLKDWLYTKTGVQEDGTFRYNLHYIYDLPFLIELQNWKLKGNFDRVSSALVGMFDIKEITMNEAALKMKPKRDTSRSRIRGISPFIN